MKCKVELNFSTINNIAISKENNKFQNKIIVFSLFRYTYSIFKYSHNDLLPRVQSAFYNVLAVGSSFVRVSVEYPFTFQPSPSRRFLFLERFSACRLPRFILPLSNTEHMDRKNVTRTRLDCTRVESVRGKL